MKYTKAFLDEKFRLFNKTIFGNRLPKPFIELSHARSFIGKCIYTIDKRSLWTNKRNGICTLRFSTSFDFPERDLEDVIIHEMIHYHIAYEGLKDSSPHGHIFLKMMEDINDKYGRNISVRTRIESRDGERKMTPKPEKDFSMHVVAVVTFKDGRKGIKVLPRIEQRIATYYNTVLASAEVDSISLHYTYDTFFDRYPTSSVLKVHMVDMKEIEKYFEDSKRMYCKGDEVVFEDGRK